MLVPWVLTEGDGAVFSDEECAMPKDTRCEKEARTFVNAFTLRCICDAINVAVESGGN